jgi:hypothetical protein
MGVNEEQGQEKAHAERPMEERGRIRKPLMRDEEAEAGRMMRGAEARAYGKETMT